MNRNFNLIMNTVFKNSIDPDEACSLVGSVYQPHKLNLCRASDQLSASMEHYPVSETSISRLTYNANIHIQSEPFQNFYLIMLPVRGHFNIRQNNIEKTASVGSPVILDTDKNIDMQWSNNCENIIFKLDKNLIDRTLLESYGVESKLAVAFNCPNREQGNLDKFSIMLNNFIINNPYLSDLTNNSEMFKNIERVLALSLLSGNHSHAEDIEKIRYRVLPKVIVKAKEFMEENYSKKITVQDIANHVCISARSLQKGFEQYECTTPTLYLRRLRLRRAREFLVFSRRENIGIKISEIAMRCGFYHFGNFSKCYLEEFGETPSATRSGRKSAL